MRRRDLLSGVLLLGGGRILAGAASIGDLSAWFTAGPLCHPDGPGMQICEGRSCVFMAAVASRAQENSKWCWAACLEMAFTCFDHRVTQEDIVKATWGDIRNAPASTDMLVETLNREYVDARGERFHPQAQLIDRTRRFSATWQRSGGPSTTWPRESPRSLQASLLAARDTRRCSSG